MTTSEILKWARAHNWSQLSVQGQHPGTYDPIRYGELNWRKAVMNASPERLARIEARIEQWNELEQKGA